MQIDRTLEQQFVPHTFTVTILLYLIHDGSRKFEFIKRDETDFLVGQIVISISATAGKINILVSASENL